MMMGVLLGWYFVAFCGVGGCDLRSISFTCRTKGHLKYIRHSAVTDKGFRVTAYGQLYLDINFDLLRSAVNYELVLLSETKKILCYESIKITTKVMNKNSKSAQILWKSITEGGFLAGIFLIGFRAIGLNELLTFLAYLLTLFVLTLTAFNIRLYNIRKDTKPSIDYVDGHEQSMKWLSKYIREATQSVWVTRFSKGFISDDSDYFKLTDRKIKGEKCSPIYVYKRLIKLDTYEKIEYTASLIQKYGVNKNFFLKY